MPGSLPYPVRTPVSDYIQITDRFNTIHAADREAACLRAMDWIKEQGHDGVVSVRPDGSSEVVTYS